jgi:hypothetical protein
VRFYSVANGVDKVSKIIKRKYKKARIEFKKDLLKKCKENKALAMLIIETYTAWHHRRHIMKIWAMFRNPNYKEFQRDYSDNLMGKSLTGRDDIWKSLYFADRELYDKYSRLIPEVYAMGDALGVAYRKLRN